MKQEPKEKQWTEADEFRLGGRLFGEVKSLVDQGKDVPDELARALGDFQQQAAIMSHGADDAGADAWYGLWSSIEAGLKDSTARQGYAESLRDQPWELPRDARAGLAKLRALEQTTAPQSWTAPEPPGEFGGRPFQLSPEARRRHSILVNPAIERDGQTLIQDSEGETWDMSEALATFRSERTRQELAQSLQSLIPGHPAMANTLGAMGGYQMVTRGVGKLEEMAGGPPVANLRTAQPGLSLPWNLPSVPDLDERLKDPLWTRALQQVMGEMEQAGELKPGAGEMFIRTTAGLLDFLAFSKGMGAAMKGAGKLALAAGLPKSTLPGMAAAKLAAGRAAEVFPLNTHFGRMAGDFMAYEVAAKAFDDRTTISEDAWRGFQQAAVFYAAGVGALATRRLLGLATRPLLKGTRLGEAAHPSMQPMEQLYADVRRFSAPTLSKALRGVVTAPAVREAVGRSVDAYLTGVYSHAYAESDSFGGFWRAALSRGAQETGLAFALNAGVQAALGVRRQVNEIMQGPIGQRLMRSIAERMASPRAGEDHRAIWQQFNEWREAEPEAFEGLVKMNAPAAERRRREEANVQAVRSIIGWRPDEGPPPSSTEVERLPEVQGSALERFRMAAATGEAELQQVAAKTQHPQYLVGELPSQTLQDIGFESHRHGLNAVHEYLRTVEGNSETKFERLSEVPRALWERTLDWRDRQKMLPIHRGTGTELVEQLGAEPVRRQERAVQGELTEIPGNEYRGEAPLPIEPAGKPSGKAEQVIAGWLDRSAREMMAEAAAEDIVDAEAEGKITLRGFIDKILGDKGFVRALNPKARRSLEKEAQRVGGIRIGELKSSGPTGDEFVKDIFDLIRFITHEDHPTFESVLGENKLLFGFLLKLGEAQRQFESNTNPFAEKPSAPMSPSGAAQMTLGDAAALVERTEGNRAYEGLAPLERAAAATVKAAKRRPALGRAMELVSTGKKSVEWLRQTFPEGRDAIGEGEPSTWIGRWERTVRDVWSARARANLRRSNVERANERATLRNFVRRAGGLRFEEDVKNLTRRELDEPRGRAPIVHEQGTARGLTLDEATEAAWEAGYFAERPTVRELIDALHEDMPGPRHSGERAAREAEREMAEMHGAQLRAFREKLESGEEPLPDDLEARRKLISDVYAGDARFDGLTPERQERQLLELRAQAAAGDPGPVDAAPPVTTRDLALQAATGYRRLLEDLKAFGVVELESRPSDPASMEAVMRLVAGEHLAGLPKGTEERYVERARVTRDQHREAVRSLLEENREIGPEVRANIDAAWEAIDARLRGESMSEATRARLSKLRWLDENGELASHREEKLVYDMAELLWQAVGRFEAPSEGLDFIVSGLPMPLAFSGRKWTRVEESGPGKWLDWQYIYSRPAFQAAMQSAVNRRIFRTLVGIGAMPGLNVFNLGPLSRPQDSKTKVAVRQNQLYRGLLGSQTRALEMRASSLVSELFAPFGGRRMPQDHSDFYDWGHRTGAFRNATGPADFERLKAGTGYLWRVYTEMASLKREIAQQAQRMGLLSEGQAMELDGRYLTQAFVRQQIESEAEALGRGEIPVAGTGRAMMREDGLPNPAEGVMKLNDAAYQEMRGVRDWSLLLRVVGDWWNPILFDHFRTAEEVASMHPLVREDHALAGVRINVPRGSTMVQEVADMARTGRYEPETLRLSARLQKLHELMAKEGEKPTPGQIPYSEQLDTLVKTYLDKGLYLPKGVLQEMDMASEELFTSPGSSPWASAARALDLFGGFTKRGLTAMRPAAITLDYLSSAMNNHVGRAVPLWDFLAGHVGIRSFTSDGLRGGQLYMRWVREGLPTERPEGWSDAEWLDLSKAKRFMEAAGYSTSVFSVIGPEIAEAYGTALDNPFQLKAALSMELERQAAANGWTPSQKERLASRIADIARGQARGLEGVDIKIAQLMGESDPAAHARGIAAWAAWRHLIEVFAFKYPAFLRAQHDWPDSTYSAVLEHALSKTSNIGDTSPWMRRWLSMHTPWNDRLWRAAEGTIKVPGTKIELSKGWAKIIVSQLFRNRFYTYPATMTPQMLRWSVTNPIGFIGTALATAGISQLIWGSMDEEERMRLEEEYRTARQGAARWAALSQEQGEAYRRVLQGLPVGPLGGRLRLPAGLVERARQLWDALPGDFLTVPMPRHGGESRVSSLAQLTPAGFLSDRARGLANLGAAVADAGEGRAREAMTGLDRLYGITGQLVLGTVAGTLTGQDPIIQALGGRGSLTEALATKVGGMMGRAGLLYPKLGLFTPEGIFIGENVALNGQDWRQHMRGIVSARAPQGAGEALASSALRAVWPSRALYQKPMLREPDDGWTALLSELYGPGFDASTAEGRTALRAGKWVNAQMAVLMGDLYERHFDDGGEPGAAEVTLDERVVGALRETWEHTRQGLDGWTIEPEYQPKGLLLRAIADFEPSERAAVIDYLHRWVERPTFWEDGRQWLNAAGNARELPKAVFREAMANALADPGGTRLLSWWRSEVERGDEERMGELSPLIHDVAMPSPGSRSYNDWVWLMARYAQAGIRLPPMPQEGQRSIDQALEGHARALQGGQALRNVLQKRQPSELEQLFNPR